MREETFTLKSYYITTLFHRERSIPIHSCLGSFPPRSRGTLSNWLRHSCLIETQCQTPMVLCIVIYAQAILAFCRHIDGVFNESIAPVHNTVLIVLRATANEICRTVYNCFLWLPVQCNWHHRPTLWVIIVDWDQRVCACITGRNIHVNHLCARRGQRTCCWMADSHESCFWISNTHEYGDLTSWFFFGDEESFSCEKFKPNLSTTSARNLPDPYNPSLHASRRFGEISSVAW